MTMPCDATTPQIKVIDIENKLMPHLRHEGHMPIAPSIVLFHGYEADVASVTKSGFVHEFEIKMSVSDFRADFKKGDKHQRMANRLHGKPKFINSRRGGDMNTIQCGTYWTPNYFWFCTPRGLLRIEDVPEYAGLIEFYWVKNEWEAKPRIVMTHIRKARRLHSEKTGDKISPWFLKRLTNIVAFGRSSMVSDEPFSNSSQNL